MRDKMRERGTRNRLASLILMLVMMASVISAVPLTANAASVTKTEKKYDIAVVFDNSGSMYQNQGWCRAKYAMEIFASMLDYGKDKLHIFPMWEVTTDGSQPNSGGSYAAIEIKSKQDIDKISNLYTVRPSNTPFAPITEAYEYLKTSGADEKWLVILTDGAFNQEARGRNTSIDLQRRVPSLASAEIKVQYLGFGSATALKANEANNFFAKKSSDTSLKDDLVEICNSIFQRSVLPSNRLSGTSLKLDLSMKNLIVFAQGANATITSLQTADGKEIGTTLDSGQRKYSEVKARGYEDAPVDRSLAGQVVTFAECAKGEYTLSVSGADAIEIFYEPDVDIEVTLQNSDGEVIKEPDVFIAGEYTVTSRIVDRLTGEDVTTHELMGNAVELKTYVKTSKDVGFVEYANGSKIVFEPDGETEILVEGEYLGKYKITSRDDPNLAWLTGVEIKNPVVDFDIDVAVLQSNAWFKTKKHDDWKPIEVRLTIDGQPLTEEQMANTQFGITISGDLKYRMEPVSDESRYNVYIAQDEAGKYIEPENGKYSIKATATYVDEYGKETPAEDSADFEIQWYSAFWRWLLWVLIALGILIIINRIRNHPTMPSEVSIAFPQTVRPLKIDGKLVPLSSDLHKRVLGCTAKPCTPFKVRGKRWAAFEVENIKPGPNVVWYSISGQRFERNETGKFLNRKNQTVDQVRPRVRIGEGTKIVWGTKQRTVEGKIYINHN